MARKEAELSFRGNRNSKRIYFWLVLTREKGEGHFISRAEGWRSPRPPLSQKKVWQTYPWRCKGGKQTAESWSSFSVRGRRAWLGSGCEKGGRCKQLSGSACSGGRERGGPRGEKKTTKTSLYYLSLSVGQKKREEKRLGGKKGK